MNYYNEFDPKAAAWLRELIAQGHIPPGHVDERSIADIRPDELTAFTQCHFFAGVGGWSLALALAGWARRRPVWTGSCPCQPFSAAGKQRGTADERHLWPAFFRLINACRPPIIFGEQVASAAVIGRAAKATKQGAGNPTEQVWLDGVCADFESAHYACAAADIPAAGIGAPHLRQRLWWFSCDTNAGHEQLRGRAGAGETTGGRSQCEAARRGLVGGLADADGGLAGHGGLQPSGRHDEQPQDEAARRVEHTQGDGWEQRRPEPSGRGAASGCGVGGLGNASGKGLQEWGDGERGTADLQCSPIERAGAWSDFDLLPCLDGKTRRIESGTFPLAHGVPGRVGLLRGYGNAIVPLVASEFIKATGLI